MKLNEVLSDADRESISDRYGHGDCPLLAYGILKRYGLAAVIFLSNQHGAYHVANKYKDNYFDAYGLSTLKEIVDRYPKNYNPDKIKIDTTGKFIEKAWDFLATDYEAEIEEALDECKPLINEFGIK